MLGKRWSLQLGCVWSEMKFGKNVEIALLVYRSVEMTSVS